MWCHVSYHVTWSVIILVDTHTQLELQEQVQQRQSLVSKKEELTTANEGLKRDIEVGQSVFDLIHNSSLFVNHYRVHLISSNL